MAPHSTTVACFVSSLYIRLRLSIAGPRNEHEGRLGLGLLEKRFEMVERARRGIAFAFGHEQDLRLRDQDDATRHHHGHRANGRHELRHAVGQLVAARHVSRVDAFDVEGAQPFVDDLGEFRRQRGFLDVVFAEEQIERIRAAGFDLLSDSGWGGYGHRLATKTRRHEKRRSTQKPQNTQRSDNSASSARSALNVVFMTFVSSSSAGVNIRTLRESR